MTSHEPLTTERLSLEPLVVEHARLLYEPLSDERIYTYIPQDAPSSSKALEERYDMLSSRMSPDGSEVWLNFAVRLKDYETPDSGFFTYVGTLQATLYSDDIADIAYIIFPEFWRRGYAREGCFRVLDHLKLDHGIVRVVAEMDTRNTASFALVESLGFERVATTYDADHFKGSSSHEYRYERTI